MDEKMVQEKANQAAKSVVDDNQAFDEYEAFKGAHAASMKSVGPEKVKQDGHGNLGGSFNTDTVTDNDGSQIRRTLEHLHPGGTIRTFSADTTQAGEQVQVQYKARTDLTSTGRRPVSKTRVVRNNDQGEVVYEHTTKDPHFASTVGKYVSKKIHNNST